MDTNLSF